MDEFVNDKIKYTKSRNRIIKAIGIAVAVLALVIIVCSMIVNIPVGYIGVETRLNKVTGRIYTEGVSLKAPFVTEVTRFNIRIRDMDEIQTQAELSGQEIVYLTVQTKFKLDSGKVIDVYREAGVNYIDYLAPRNEIIDVIKAVIARHSIDEFASSRDMIGTEVLDKLNERFNQKGIIFTSFSIPNYNFDTAMEQAISEMNTAAQTRKTQAIQIDTEKARAEADREIARTNAQKEAEIRKIEAEAEAQAVKIKAEGEAEAIRIRAEAEAAANAALAASITPELIEYNEVERWNGSKATVITSGSVITDINQETAQ